MPGVPAGPMTIKSLPVDQYLHGLDKVFWNVTDTVLTYTDQMYATQTEVLFQLREQSMSGVPPAVKWGANGDSMALQVVNFRFNITLTRQWFANAIAYTLDQKWHNNYKVMDEAAPQLAMSLKHAEALIAAQLWEEGFSNAWCADLNAQEAWFYAAHPLDPRTNGLTYSNLMTGGLSVAKLQSAITLLEQTPDDLGRPMHLRAKYLVIPKALQWATVEVLGKGMEYRSDTANRTKNAFEEKVKGLQIIENEWLDSFSPTAWFLVADKNGCIWNWDQAPTGRMHGDPYTESTFHFARMAQMNGVRDWRGVVGSQG